MKKLSIALILIFALAIPAFAAKADKTTKESPKEPAGNPIVLIETNMGNIKIELFEKESPISVKNFLSYVKSGFYKDTIFHRVIPNFMIQGGGFTKNMIEEPTKSPIKNEAANGLKNDRGTLAMARTMIVDSASAQFFINLKNNDFLNYSNSSMQGYGYAVFGKVIEGMDVVDKIAQVPTGIVGDYSDVPKAQVVIKSMRILK